MTLPTVELPPSLERRLSRGHPWVYRDHISEALRFETGSWVRLRAGRFVGYGLWDADSPIALRVYSRKGILDRASVTERVRAAHARRAAIRYRGDTDAFRLIHGEGDRLPGIVVDRYGDFAVVSTDTPAVEPLVGWLVEAVSELPSIRGVLRRRRDGAGPRARVVLGEAPPELLTVQERGLVLRANLYSGQKTGLFLDHRENRHFIESIAARRTVLNLYAYTGAFSLYALRGGAREVTSVDRAARAIEDAKENFTLNGYDPAAHAFVAEDVEGFLQRARQDGRIFDLVICDPPSFARSRAQADRAESAYARLTDSALRLVAPGGLYAAASCTTQVSPATFIEILARAAARARRDLLVVHEAGHAADHPVLAGHPEGRYLKFVVARVEPVV